MPYYGIAHTHGSMRLVLLVAALLAGAVAPHAQSPSRTGLYVELGGHGGIYSLGVDRQLVGGPAAEAFVRAGASVLPDLFGDGVFVTVPATVGAAVTIPTSVLAVEGGVGATGVYLSDPTALFSSEDPPALQVMPTASMALRIYPVPGRPLALRLGGTGFLDLNHDGDGVPTFGTLMLGVTAGR